MDGGTMDVMEIRQRVSRDTWQSRIHDCRSSGLTISAWCEQHNIRESTYYYWLRKLRQELVVSKSIDSRDLANPSFCEIDLADSHVGATEGVTALKLQLPGLLLEISSSANPQEIRVAYSVLKSLC